MSGEGLPAGFTDTDIAVVGMALRVPGARSLESYWRNLRDGVESVTRFDDDELRAAGVDDALLENPNYVKSGAILSDMEMFDAGFFGFNPLEASIMDPQHRHFLEVSWEALESAGHPPENFPGSIGVFGGSGHNSYMPYHLFTNPDLMESTGFFLVRHTGNDKDFLSTRVSYLLDLKGPSINIQTACSTSLVAIHMASQSLLNGECDMALAGAATIELPHRQGYLYKDTEILSQDGHCRSFDADSGGTIFGSGVGIVVLRRLADALEDGDFIHAVIKGSAVNNDGSGKVGYLAPSVDGQAQAIAEALAIADVDADTIGYVEAHGTGTPVGDPIEAAALTQAYRQFTDKTEFCKIGSVKSNIGHLDTAAGVAGFIKVALALRHGQIPPSLHFKSPNPACHFDTSPFVVNDQLSQWSNADHPRRAGISSLGVGGTNAHVIMQEAPESVPSSTSRTWQLLPLSAKSSSALQRTTANLSDYLADQPELDLAEVAYTLQVGRSAMAHRSIVVAESVADAVKAFEDQEGGRVFSGEAPANERSVAFMFAGGGAQYPNMGAELYRDEPVYREAVDECLELLDSMIDYDLKSLLYPAPGSEEEAARQLERPSITLPALFTTQYAQTKLWASWGVEPAAMIGHSMGEYTAAHFAGVFDLRNALALVLLRGQLFESVPRGGMLSVPLGAEALEAIMDESLSIAALNGPELSVASGPVEAIENLEAALNERDIDSVRVRISIAAHSMMLDSILEEFEAFFQKVTLSPPELPFVSNLSGTWITPEEATDPAYWVRHLRNTVRFAEGVAELYAGDHTLLEVGPGRTLATLARQYPGRPEGVEPLNSMRHPDDEISDKAFMLTALGRLWLAGTPVDWTAHHEAVPPSRVPLPTYPFERQRHWVEPGSAAVPSATAAEKEDPLAKRTDVKDWSYQPVWHRVPLENDTPGNQPAGRVLICGGPDALAGAIEDRLVGEGHDILRVHRSNEYAEDPSGSFGLDPSQAEHWNRLVSNLGTSDRIPEWIFYLWPTTDEAAPAEDLEEALVTSFYGPLYLAQALGNEAVDDEIRLALVSNRVYCVAGESVLEPGKATLQGPCRVIPREFPNITCVHADVEITQGTTWKTAHLAQQLVSELGGGAGEEVVAFRGMDRWVERFDEVTLPEDGPGRLRSQGVYLITGGLGGIGLTLAEHLAKAYQARLVLLGRTGVPAREEWDDWIGHHGHDHAVSRKIDGIRAVEAAGGEVLALSLDVTDPEAMRDAVAQAMDLFGAVNGVFHTAGVLEDGVIQLKEPEVAARVLAPKVMGTVALDAALTDVPVDFVVLFSSVSAFSGLAGQVDYAAANAFLDAWAHHQLVVGGPPTVAVNWSAWRDVGMAADMARQLGIAQDDHHESTGTPVEHPLLDLCVLDGRDERVYLTNFSVARHWLLAEHRLHDGDALIPGTGYLELARAAFEQHPQSRPVDIRDVAFLSPFVVTEDEERELRVTVKRNGQSASDFTIASRQPDGAKADHWQEHVRGTIRYRDDAPGDVGDPELIRARCEAGGSIVTTQQDPVHLDFGPRWQNIQCITYGDGEALMDLALPEDYIGDLEWFGLHPAVMDMATAGARQLIPDLDDDEDFYVPLSYGSLTAYGPLPQRVHSHLRYREDLSTAKEFAVFDIAILDEDGRVVVDIAEFIMIRIRDKALLAAPAAEDGAASSAESGSGRPQSTANNILSVSLEAGIRPAEGMTALEMVLSHASVPQTVVSTQRLDALIDLLRTPVQPESPAPRRADAEPRRDLSPVETVLADHEAVAEAAAREFEERPGDWRLIAYVVYDPEEEATVSELRRHVRRSLSDDFVPHAFIELETMPRLPDGGIDRGSLESPFAGAEELVEPRTATERTIAALWQKLLGVEAIGVYDNFFDIGGHSLLSMRLISQVDKQLGVRLQHEHIVINTLEQLAAKCDQQLGNVPETEDVAAESGVA